MKQLFREKRKLGGGRRRRVKRSQKRKNENENENEFFVFFFYFRDQKQFFDFTHTNTPPSFCFFLPDHAGPRHDYHSVHCEQKFPSTRAHEGRKTRRRKEKRMTAGEAFGGLQVQKKTKDVPPRASTHNNKGGSSIK